MIGTKVEETQMLEKFGENVKDLKQDEYTLRRFLKARNNDLIKAEDMIRKWADWRHANKVDDALNWNIPEAIVDSFPIEYPGLDSKGRAIMYIGLGTWPLRPMVEKGHGAEMMRYIRVCLEKLVSEMRKTDQKQFTFILDLGGISLWTNAHYETSQVILTTFREFEAYYPEILSEAFLINAPFIFNYLWPLIKALLTGSTISKLQIFGCNEAKYIPIILGKIPKASLPKKLKEVADKMKL